MARSSTARRLDEALPPSEAKRPTFGGGEPPTPPVRPNVTIGSNAWVAVVVFLGAEAMFFAGLIGAYIVFRVSAPIWPPPFQPRLPIGVTGFNTLILIASAVTMRLAVKAVSLSDRKKLIRLLGLTAILGVIFLAVQGYEWVRLFHFGLTLSSSVYGGLFYTLIGFHGLHVDRRIDLAFDSSSYSQRKGDFRRNATSVYRPAASTGRLSWLCGRYFTAWSISFDVLFDRGESLR